MTNCKLFSEKDEGAMILVNACITERWKEYVKMRVSRDFRGVATGRVDYDFGR